MRYAVLLIALALAGCYDNDRSSSCDEPLTLPALY